MKRCRHCKEPFTPIRSTLEKYCSKSECIRVFVEEAKAKDWAKRKAKLKKEAMTVQDYIKIAQQVFNAYIRERDKGKGCISCDKPLTSKFDAGHMYSAGGHSSLRFNEYNVHGQCVECNRWKHGNLIAYFSNVMVRIGDDNLNDLIQRKHETKKFTIDELKEITATYKKKLKELKQESK